MAEREKFGFGKWFPAVVAAAVLTALAAIFDPFYIVEEGHQAVVTRFGEIVGTRSQAGLYVKIPFLDVVNDYPRLILRLDGDPQRIPTKENQFIIVDTTSRWRISDPAKFYKAFKTIDVASVRLSDIIDSEARTVVTRNTFSEVVRSSNLINETAAQSQIVPGAEDVEGEGADEGGAAFEPVLKGRRVLSNEMAEAARKMIGEFGIELIDVVPRQIGYSAEMTQSVYNRMIKERNQVAQKYRSIGEGKKAEWLGRLENEKRTILSEGYRKAEEIKGAADAEAARIYAESYSRDGEFFAFWNSMESYKKTVPKFDATLGTDWQYFKYLYSPSGN